MLPRTDFGNLFRFALYFSLWRSIVAAVVVVVVVVDVVVGSFESCSFLFQRITPSSWKGVAIELEKRNATKKNGEQLFFLLLETYTHQKNKTRTGGE